MTEKKEGSTTPPLYCAIKLPNMMFSHDQNGNILLMSMIFLAVTSMIAITGIKISMQASRASSNATNEIFVFHATESGIQHAIRLLSQAESDLFKTVIDTGSRLVDDPTPDDWLITTIEIIYKDVSFPENQWIPNTNIAIYSIASLEIRSETIDRVKHGYALHVQGIDKIMALTNPTYLHNTQYITALKSKKTWWYSQAK